MTTMDNFYDNLDLKYPEIAIAMEQIDRINPGKIKFIIPVLTPNMSTSKLEETKIYQNSSNLQNSDTKPEVETLDATNYIKIKVPRELCAYVGGVFELLEAQVWPGKENAKDINSVLHVRDADTTIRNAHQVGSGTVRGGGLPCGGGNRINVTGSVKGTMNFNNGIPKGYLNLMPVDRYIKKGSKWIVVFIGGDITKPKIISRYFDDD